VNNRVSVAWFASAFLERNASGTAQTARKIIEYLIEKEYSRIQVVLIAKSDTEVEKILNDKILSEVKILCFPKVKGSFLKSSRQFYKFALSKNTEKVDILHFSVPRLYPFYWIFPAKRFFCTFHAGGEFSVPQDKFVMSRHIYNWIAKFQWRKLDRIFADSEFGLQEIKKFYKIPRSRIEIVYLGADHLWNIPIETTVIHDSKFNIAIIGRWQKYKNIHTIVEAYLDLEASNKGDIHLYIIGKQNMSGNKLVQKVIEKVPQENISIFNYLTDGELKYIYQNVQLVIHPSINEGFGLPAFEAFGEGAPVAVHNGLPADQYLASQSQVYVLDMKNKNSVLELLKNRNNITRTNDNSRKKFLIDNSMTWDKMCAEYVNYYLSNR